MEHNIVLTGENTEGFIEIEYNNTTVEIKPMLSYTEMLTFVNTVVKACFDEDTGEYVPEIRDYATRFAIFRMYTNVDIPEDTEECYMFVYQLGDLLLEIMENIDDAQFDAMDRSISAKVNNALDLRANETNKRFDNLYNAIMNLTQQFADMFGELEEDDIKNVISSLQEAGFDENRFVETYMKQVQKKG